MASYNSATYTAVTAGKTPIPSHGLAGNVKSIGATVATDTSMALNDVLNFFTLPKGARIVSARLRSTDLDSNGSPTITLDVGDAGSATRLFSASIVAQAGGLDAVVQSTGWGYQVTADTPIFGTVHAAAATKAAGSVRLEIDYTVDGLAS